jgi:hypothetical protein
MELRSMSYHGIGLNLDTSSGAQAPPMPPCVSQAQHDAAVSACSRSRELRGLGVSYGYMPHTYIPPLSQIDPCWLQVVPVCPPGTPPPEQGDTTGIEEGEGGGEEDDGGRRTLMLGGILFALLAAGGAYTYYRHRKGRRR